MIPRLTTEWIVVHATMTLPPPTVQQITWRARSYGYLDAGVHYVISPDGEQTACRPHRLVGTGCRPHNATSVIILLPGEPPFPFVQTNALYPLIKGLQALYPDAAVVGYRDLPGVRRSDSPGFDIIPWWAASDRSPGCPLASNQAL